MKLFKTSNQMMMPLAARIFVAVLVFPHGAQKLFGWFGGLGFEGTLVFFMDNYGVWPLFTVILIVIETVGPLALIAGLLTRVAAAGIAAIFFTAIFAVHGHENFLLNLVGIQEGGIVFQLLVTVLCIYLIFSGGGIWSADYAIYKRKREQFT